MDSEDQQLLMRLQPRWHGVIDSDAKEKRRKERERDKVRKKERERERERETERYSRESACTALLCSAVSVISPNRGGRVGGVKRGPIQLISSGVCCGVYRCGVCCS